MSKCLLCARQSAGNQGTRGLCRGRVMGTELRSLVPGTEVPNKATLCRSWLPRQIPAVTAL